MAAGASIGRKLTKVIADAPRAFSIERTTTTSSVVRKTEIATFCEERMATAVIRGMVTLTVDVAVDG